MWGVTGTNLKSMATCFTKGLLAGGVSLGIGYVTSTAIGSAIKLVPGVGSIIGGIIDSTVAGSFTFIMGLTALLYLRLYISKNISTLTEEEMVNWPKLLKRRIWSILRRRWLAKPKKKLPRRWKNLILPALTKTMKRKINKTWIVAKSP